ncbi:MAG TPA: hypothetical protein GX746_04895 [Bacteroidales bacterium]|nr:hypothetical protein [Bacteroidales bacterium]
MKRFRIYAILIAMITVVACSDDFVPELTTDLKEDTFMFSSEGGEQTFLLESNEQWSVGEMPDWISVSVIDAPAARATGASFEKGTKAVTILVKENSDYEERIAELTMVSISGEMAKLTIKQEQKAKLITDLESNSINFTYEGGEQSFLLETNEEWSISVLPSWLTVTVRDFEENHTRSVSYESGKKVVAFTAKENNENESRTAELVLTSVKGITIELHVEQAKKPELAGYWILSEGYAGSNNAEMAWFDVSTGEISKKQFKALNGTELGDTGNALKMYGSKMYAVITGPNWGDDSEGGLSYIEVIDPKSGKSIKRIQFKTADGVAAKPRSIVFEGGKGYISSYSNEVVRLDTASLELDAHATLSGTLAEGLTINDGKIYVCNSGQGKDNKISVVDIESMTETNVITTAMNPTGIVSAGSGVIYFSTNYPDYVLYKLTLDNEEITEMPGVNVAEMTYLNGNIYTSLFDWNTYMGEVYKFNTDTEEATPVNLDLEGVGIPMLMEYKIGTINDSDYLFLSGMGQDVVIFDSNTLEIKHALQTGVPNASGVVAVYN